MLITRKLFKKTIFIFLCFINGTQFVFSNENFIPSGFEEITNDYDGPVSIVIGLRELGDASIRYEEHKDKVILSEDAQQLILTEAVDKLTEKGKKKLKQVLGQPLQANSNLTKPYLARSSRNLAVYFSVNDLKLYVYIPYTYFKKGEINFEHKKFHPEVNDANFGYGSNLDMDVNEVGGKKFHTIAADGSFSLGRTSFQYDVSSNTTNYVDDMYLQYIGKKYIYQAGYLQPLLQETLMPSDNFFGLAIRSSPKLINSKFYSAYQIPLTLILDKEYYVQILYRGRVLYQSTLQYGTNLINTNNFPAGTYDITIKKRDLITGQVIETTQLFSKESSLYNWIYSGFEVLAGVQYKNFQTPRGSDNNKIFKIRNGFKAFGGDIDVFYAYNSKINYIGAEYDYISDDIFDYSVDLEASNKRELFARGSSYYRLGKSTYRVSASDKYRPNEPIDKNIAQINFSYLTQFKNWSMNFSTRYDSRNIFTAAGGAYKQFRYGTVLVSYGLNGSYQNQSGYQAILSLGITFTQGNIKSKLDLKQDFSKHATTIRPYVKWQKDRNYISQEITATINNASIVDNRHVSGETRAKLFGDIGSVDASINASYHNGGLNIDTKHIGFNTAIIGTLYGITLHNQRAGSGFLVRLPSLEDNNLDFAINNDLYLNGKTVFIPKQPYQYQKIVVSSPSPDYKLKKDDFKAFLYPDNIKNVRVVANKACGVSFKFKTNKTGLFEIEGYPEYFVKNGDIMDAFLPEGIPLNFVNLTDKKEKCSSHKTVTCSSDYIDLGEVKCISI